MALKLLDKAPEFKLKDADLVERSLNEFSGKNIVLAFYPGAFTSVCTKELCTLRDSLSNFENLNAQVIAISVDSPFVNKAFARINNLTFPLLSDYTRNTIKQYCGVHEDFAGLQGYTASKRAVFVIDKDKNIRYLWISENPGAEPPYGEIENTLKTI